MAKLCFTINTQASNIVQFSQIQILTSYVQLLFYTLLCNSFLFSKFISIELTDTDDYLPPDDLNITILMVSQYDCEKQLCLKQFNLLNVEQGTDAASTYKTRKLKPESVLELKPNALKLSYVKLTQRKNKKSVCFQDPVKYRTVWIHKTLLFLKLLTHLSVKLNLTSQWDKQ